MGIDDGMKEGRKEGRKDFKFDREGRDVKPKGGRKGTGYRKKGDGRRWWEGGVEGGSDVGEECKSSIQVFKRSVYLIRGMILTPEADVQKPKLPPCLPYHLILIHFKGRRGGKEDDHKGIKILIRIQEIFQMEC